MHIIFHFSNESRRALTVTTCQFFLGGEGGGGRMAGFLTRVIFFLFDFSFSLGKFVAKCGQIFISSELSHDIKFAMYITQTVFFYI